MQAHRTKAVVAKNGSLTIEKLPFPAGRPVEVVIYSANDPSPQGEKYPLHGTPIQFDNPTASVSEADWESLS